MAEKGDDAFAYLFSGDSGCEVSYCGFRREVKIGERPKPFGEEYEKRVRQFVGDLDANLKAVDGGGQFTMPLCCLERIVDEEGVGLTPYLGESQGVALASDLLELSFWWIASMGKEGVFRGVWGDFPVSLVRQDEHGDGWRSRFSLLVGNYDQASQYAQKESLPFYPHFPWPEEEMINQRDDSLSWGGKTVKFPFLTQAKRLAVQRLRVSSKEVEAASIANLSEVLLRMVNETFLAAVSDGSELLLAIQEGLDCLEEKPLGMLEIVTSYRRFGANSWEPVNPADELKANLLFGLDISRLLKKGPGIYLSFRGIPVHLVLFSKEGGDFLAMGVMVATEEKINTYNYKQRLPLRKLSE